MLEGVVGSVALFCVYPGLGGADTGRNPADEPARDPGLDDCLEEGTGGYSMALDLCPNLA